MIVTLNEITLDGDFHIYAYIEGKRDKFVLVMLQGQHVTNKSVQMLRDRATRLIERAI